MKSKGRMLGWAVAVLSCVAMSQRAFADADGAKKDIAQAQTEISNNDYKSASDNLDLATAELDGVDAAAKADLAKQIADLKDKLSSAQGSPAMRRRRSRRFRRKTRWFAWISSARSRRRGRASRR